MSLSTGGRATIAAVLNMLHPDGTGLRIANTLKKDVPMMDHMNWHEGNLQTGHLIARTDNALAEGTWRQVNQGITPATDDPTQYTETCGRLERWNEIDEALAELNGGAPWRMKQDELAAAKLGEQLAEAILYSSTSTDPEEIHGLTARYPATSGYINSGYVLAGTNSGANCRSVWLINWGDDRIYPIYPKTTRGGLEINRLANRVDIEDSAGRRFMGWRTQLVWRCGLAVEDFRAAVRIQWDPDDPAMADDQRGLLALMQRASDIVRPKQGARYYMDRTSLQKFHAQLLHGESRLWQTIKDLDQDVESYLGHPIYPTDVLTAETAIS